jgi:L-iditol 2-dehydrogenase
MKALILEEYNQFVYENVPMPKISPDDVLIEVKACGICGSDVHGMDGSSGRRIPPITMGHEASGIIVKVGKNVKYFSQGDRVTFDSTVYCGTCRYCRKRLINLCDNRQVMGVSCDEYRLNGALAEYVAVPELIVYPLPEEVSFEKAAMTEPLSIACHAVDRMPISAHDTAVIVGTGIIGLLVIQLLKNTDCGNIFAVDIEQNKLDIAGKLGAKEGFRSDIHDVPAEIFKRTENLGADIVFEAVGIAPTITIAVESVKKGGSISLIGNVSSTIDFPLQKVVTRQISAYGSCASSGEYPACLDMIARNKVNVDALISRVAPLSEGALWFERLKRQEAGLLKVILVP